MYNMYIDADKIELPFLPVWAKLNTKVLIIL